MMQAALSRQSTCVTQCAHFAPSQPRERRACARSAAAVATQRCRTTAALPPLQANGNAQQHTPEPTCLHEQQQPDVPMLGRRVTMLATAFGTPLLWWPHAVDAAPIPAVGGGNAAVMDSLRKLKKQQRFEDSLAGEDPRAALAGRFEAVQGQLQKCILLVKINQYDSARMQLREGAFKSLRLDLGYGQEMYRLVSGKEAREVVEGVERLDGALKRRETLETLEPIISGLAERLKAISEAAARIEEIS